MAKYQLVLIKLQAAMSKLVRMAKAQDLCRLQRGFLKYRANVTAVRSVQDSRARLLLDRMRSSIQGLASIYSRRLRSHLVRFTERWRFASAKARLLKELSRRAAASEEKHRKDLASRDHKIAALEQRAQQQVAEAAALKESEKTLRQTAKEKEERERALKETLDRARKREGEDRKLPRSVEERVQALEAHVATMETENKELRERLESTENNVGGFVQEVSELLDSHEFVSMQSSMIRGRAEAGGVRDQRKPGG